MKQKLIDVLPGLPKTDGWKPRLGPVTKETGKGYGKEKNKVLQLYSDCSLWKSNLRTYSVRDMEVIE